MKRRKKKIKGQTPGSKKKETMVFMPSGAQKRRGFYMF
jgi:hypothetical protein